ncbi:TPA: type II toxin-antitoxin system mRNA interferase toxin, RelE/StbE family [Candidatus Nomurabacteria bacterium]|nr:type II toxin-antitoxin system mRNA interferase toxin, RelE/StbE family [Candidatus Nomurabacteria bacterium]
MKKREILYDNSFHKQFKKIIKNNKELEEKSIKVLEILKENVFDSKLSTHKLSGELKKYYSAKVTFDIRVLFYFDDEYIYLIDIGNHNDVY